MPTPLSRYSPQDAIDQQTKSLKVDEATIQNMISQLGGGQQGSSPIQINSNYQQPSVQRDMASLEAAMLMGNANQNPERFGGHAANRAMQQNALRLESEAQEQQQQASQQKAMQEQQMAEQAEIERRKEYVMNVGPMLEARYPGMDPEKIKAMALQAAAQNTPIDKLLPDTAGKADKPIAQEVTNPDGSKTTRYVDPQTGKPVQGGWDSFSSGNAPEKPSTTRFVKRTNPDGSEVELEYNSNREVVNEIQTAPPLPTGQKLKAFADMAGESRVKLGLTSTAAHSFSEAIEKLAPDGKFASNLARLKPASPERAAYLTMMSGVLDNLRMVTGAAIMDTEVERDIERFIPNVSDSNEIGMSKLRNLYRTLNTNYQAMTYGYEDIESEALQWPSMPMWLKEKGGSGGKESGPQSELDKRFEATMAALQNK